MDLMHRVYGPHCAVNDNMISASQIDEIGEDYDNEEAQEFEEEEDDGDDDDDDDEEEEDDEEENFTYNVPENRGQFSFGNEFRGQQPVGNFPSGSSMPVPIPSRARQSRQGGDRGGFTINRGRGQSTRQPRQTPRRRAVMDTHLTNIGSYLANMQTPIQMLNARTQANEDYERESWLQLNELENIEKFTDFWWASSEILRDPFEQKRFVLLRSNEERVRFLEGVIGYDRSGTFRGSPWKRQLSGSSGPSSRGSFGSGSGSPSVGGLPQYNTAGGTPNFSVDGTSSVGGFSQFAGSGSPHQYGTKQGFQAPNWNPQFTTSPNPRVASSENLGFRSASAAELMNRFNLSDFNRNIRNNDNDDEN